MTRCRDDPKRGAAEGGVHLRRQFLECILPGAEGAVEVAIEAESMAGGVFLCRYRHKTHSADFRITPLGVVIPSPFHCTGKPALRNPSASLSIKSG